MLSIIIVSFNTHALLRQCLRSIYENQGLLDIEIIVVDNASADQSVEMIDTEFPSVKLVANAENRGFAAANNQGIAASKGQYLLILNPDTIILPDSLQRLVTCMDDHPEAGVVGPEQVSKDGSPQFVQTRFPSVWNYVVWASGLGRWPYEFAKRGVGHYGIPQEIRYVDWVAGSAMLVRREVVNQVGGFDESLFLLSEDVDWCYRIKAAGWQIAYLPHVTIVHYGGKSMTKDWMRRVVNTHQARLYFVHKHYGTIQFGIFKVLLLIESLFKIIVLALVSLVKPSPAYAQRLRGYIHLVKTWMQPVSFSRYE